VSGANHVYDMNLNVLRRAEVQVVSGADHVYDMKTVVFTQKKVQW
jgi:hypothetical protein